MLRPSNAAELDALVESQYDPTSPAYEQWLTPDEFSRLFAPGADQVEAARTSLRGAGLSDTTVDGFTVRATAPSQTVADALGVSFSSYSLADGTTGYSASSAPLVPAALAGSIETVIGLSDTVRFENRLELPPDPAAGGNARALPRATTNAVAAPRACPAARSYAGSRFWTPDQVGSIYGVNELFSRGMTGQGRTIGILEFAPSRPADTQHFLSCFALHNQVTVKKVDGGGTIDSFGSLEAEIDIQSAASGHARRHRPS